MERKKAFYIYDERMLEHKDYTTDGVDGYKIPEIPERISCIYNHLQSKGYSNIITLNFSYRMLDHMDKVDIENEDNIEELLELVHTKELINKVKEETSKLETGEPFYATKWEYYLCKESYEAAKISASGVVTGMKKILESKYDRGYCIVRPPGHHANHEASMGFCLFNNVALAAKMATSGPYNLERVCIFDWDIHHGDGT